ncbi:hypothetical protein ACOTBX_10295 [Achromobacter xylosoxidans]
MTQQSIAVSTTPPLPGLSMVQQVNAALQTIATDFSGDTDPAALAGPYMIWADTLNGLVKRRNAAGSDWVVLGPLLAEQATPADGALYASQAWATAKFDRIYTAATVPVAEGPPIFVSDGAARGVWTWWNGTRYMPDRRAPGYRFGGLMTHASTSVTVAAGEWRDNANGLDIVLPSAMTKTIQASGAWAAGNNQNGLFSGARANSTWYEVFVIVNDSTGAVDVGFDTNATAANRPAGWTAYQLVGSVYVDGTGSIKPFLNPALREFVWVQRTQDVNGGPASDASVGTAVTLAVPLRRRVMATIGVWLDASNPASAVSISSVDAVPSSVGTGGAIGDVFRAASPTAHFNTLEVLTSNSGQIIAKAGSGGAITTALSIGTRGWREIF